MPSHSLSSFTLTCSKCSHKKIYDYDYLNNLMENDESLDFSNFNKIVPRIKCRKCKKKNFIIEDENDNLIFDTDHGVNCRECNLLIPFTRLYAVPGTQVCTSCKEIENDSEGLVFPLVPNGFKTEKLIAYKEKKGTVVGFPGSKKVTTEQLLTAKCDVLVPGALENQINAKIAKNLKCKIIGEAANGPTLPEADPIIFKKKIMVIPDILANSGGVCISYLEWVQDNQGYFWSFDDVASKMESHITKGFKDTLAMSKKHKIDMRKAAMVVAVARVLEAFDHRGLWP